MFLYLQMRIESQSQLPNHPIWFIVNILEMSHISNHDVLETQLVFLYSKLPTIYTRKWLVMVKTNIRHESITIIDNLVNWPSSMQYLSGTSAGAVPRFLHCSLGQKDMTLSPFAGYLLVSIYQAKHNCCCLTPCFWILLSHSQFSSVVSWLLLSTQILWMEINNEGKVT